MTALEERGVAASAVVTYETEGRTAVLTIDNPPVNASSAAVRSGLIAGIGRAAEDGDVDNVVLIGAGGNFVSGSDLTEFAADELPEPTLPDVVAAIERCPKPVVAALSGATLGGGLELALGCDARIASRDAVIGLPEITLGMIPGAGGTQRPLRLIGAAATLEFVTSGARRPVSSAAGLLDEVTEAPLRDAACHHAAALTGKRILRTEIVRPDDPTELGQAITDALRRGRGRPQYAAAVAAVLSGLALDSDTAFTFERNEFNRLRVSSTARALRHLFFARRAAHKAARPSTPRPVTQVGVIGAGTMGAGISRAFVEHDIPVVLIDQNGPAAVRAVDAVRSTFERAVADGRVDAAVADRRRQLLTTGSSLSDLSGCDLVIEAVFEDMAVKKDLLNRLQDALPPSVVFATNTSYLDIDDMSKVLRQPERLVGMHFFSPAHRAAVVEVVRAERTSRDAMDCAFRATAALAKTAIVARVCYGFIGNRIYNAYRRQCELMLEEGALPHQVDRALVEFGFAMGPFAVSDMSGLDIAWRMRQASAHQRDPRERYPDVADTLCEAGRLGQKTGAGWYRYDSGSRKPLVDPEVDALVIASSARKGLTRRDFTPAEIVDRAVLAMANEAALLLADGIAERSGDIDLMLTMAYGFPEHIGGLTPWVQAHRDGLGQRLEGLAAASGFGFRRGDLALLGASR